MNLLLFSMIDKQKILDFLFKEQKKTYRQISRLNDPAFVRKRKTRTRINYLKSFELKFVVDEQGNATYTYSDTHYYDTVRNVFLQFAKDKGLPEKAGYAIARKKLAGVSNVVDVFVFDRKRVFKSIAKFIDNELIEEFVKNIEQNIEKNIKNN